MKKHNARKKKLQQRKFAAIAAYSRQFTVNNMPKGKPVIPKDKLEKVVFGEKDVHYVQKAEEWKTVKTPQPKRLQHTWKRWIVVKDEETELYTKKLVTHRSDYIPYNKLKDEPHEICGITRYPHPHKMPMQTYCERLTQCCVEKWKKKHPEPQVESQDMFDTTKQVPWKMKLQMAEEAIRERVISTYHKLILTGRYKINKDGQASYQEMKIAEIEDVNGDGHRINDVGNNSPVIQKAQEVVNKMHARDNNLVCGNLHAHKQGIGRIILPKMRQAA